MLLTCRRSALTIGDFHKHQGHVYTGSAIQKHFDNSNKDIGGQIKKTKVQAQFLFFPHTHPLLINSLACLDVSGVAKSGGVAAYRNE